MLLVLGKSSWAINSTFYCTYSNFYTLIEKNYRGEYYAVFIGVLKSRKFGV
jgi:hypothetical protein